MMVATHDANVFGAAEHDPERGVVASQKRSASVPIAGAALRWKMLRRSLLICFVIFGLLYFVWTAFWSWFSPRPVISLVPETVPELFDALPPRLPHLASSDSASEASDGIGAEVGKAPSSAEDELATSSLPRESLLASDTSADEPTPTEGPEAVPTAAPTNSPPWLTSKLVWNKKHALGQDGSSSCYKRRATFGSDLCLRPYRDLVSEAVRRDGHWGECSTLVELWTSPLLKRKAGSRDIFVDIGANIGMCDIHMAASTSAHAIVAFEPSESNLFYLTSTMLLNKRHLSRIHVYPVGLGETTAELPIFAEPLNAGHSVVGKPLSEEHRPKVMPVGKVQVHRLDDLIQAPYPDVRLMKIDVEGLETQVLRGGRAFLSSGAVRAIFFELSPFLQGHGSSRVELINLFLDYGFVFYDIDGDPMPMSMNRLRGLACRECGNCFDNLFTIGRHEQSKVGNQEKLSGCSWGLT